MAELVADYVLRRLAKWGIDRIYGYPGDGINGFLGALDQPSRARTARRAGALAGTAVAALGLVAIVGRP
jgi:thiamine pyrophosphate-dependent acetolactate synthase large subunit-like protein